MDINAKSIPLHEAAESLGCDVEVIRDIARIGRVDIFILIDDSWDGERRKTRTSSDSSNRIVEDILQGLEGPLLFEVSPRDMDAAIDGDGISSLRGHWRDDPNLLGGDGDRDFIDYTFRPADKINLPLSSPLWRVMVDDLLPLKETIISRTMGWSPKGQPPHSMKVVVEQGADTVIYGWGEMESHTGLTRGKIRYRATDKGYQFVKEDPRNPNSKPGLTVRQLNDIAYYKRSNAVT